MRRVHLRLWLRSLNAHLFLWAVLPVAFAVVAFSFSGVYTHQEAIKEYVADRDLIIVRLSASLIENGLARDLVGVDGEHLGEWMASTIGDQAETMVVDGNGRVLAHSDPRQVNLDMSGDACVMEALRLRDGVKVVEDEIMGSVLVAFAPVTGTDWVILKGEPVTGLIGPVLHFQGLVPVIAAGAGILSLLVVVLGWRAIVRPLQRLAKAAGEVSWGEFLSVHESAGEVQEVRDLA